MEERSRIDDLAQRAGLTVDTIRYYQRERLLMPPVRDGRHKLYGPEHLERLATIRALQERRFSLAAIRALLDTGPLGLAEGVFGGDATGYDLPTLIERSGADTDLVERLRDAGLLRDPADFGRDSYDSRDLDVLRAVVELRDRGLPPDVVADLARIYVEGVEAMQYQVLELFRGRRVGDWTAEELTAVQTRAASQAGELLPLVSRLVEYVHQKTLERLTLNALRRARD